MKVLVLITLSLLPLTSYAGCKLDGREYPAGAVVNGYVCGEDGYWKKLSE